jgi:hypothetical protein
MISYCQTLKMMIRFFVSVLLYSCVALILSGQEKPDSWRENHFSGQPIQAGNKAQNIFVFTQDEAFIYKAN